MRREIITIIDGRDYQVHPLAPFTTLNSRLTTHHYSRDATLRNLLQFWDKFVRRRWLGVPASAYFNRQTSW